MLNKDLEAKLQAVARRHHVQKRMHATVTAVLVAACAAVVGLTARTLWPVAYFYVVAAAVLIGSATYWHRRPRGISLFKAAQTADDKLGLDERLATAVEWKPRRPDHVPLAAKLQADAARFAPLISPRRLVPYRLPRRSWLLMPLLLLGAMLMVANPVVHWPGTDSLALDEVGPEADLTPDDWQAASDQLKQLAEMRDDDGLRQLAHRLDDLLSRWRRGKLSKAELERELAALENRLNAMLDTGPLSAPLTDGTDASGMDVPRPQDNLGGSPTDTIQPEEPAGGGPAPGQGTSDSNTQGDSAADGDGHGGETVFEAGADPRFPEDDGDGSVRPHEDAEAAPDRPVGESEIDSNPVPNNGTDTGPAAPPGGSASADDTAENGTSRRPPAPSDDPQPMSAPGSSEDGTIGDDPGSDPSHDRGGQHEQRDDDTRPDVTFIRERAPGIVSTPDGTTRALSTTSGFQATGSTAAQDPPVTAVTPGAESSVEQEHIPLAYRHWVRLYFQQTGDVTADGE